MILKILFFCICCIGHIIAMKPQRKITNITSIILTIVPSKTFGLINDKRIPIEGYISAFLSGFSCDHKIELLPNPCPEQTGDAYVLYHNKYTHDELVRAVAQGILDIYPLHCHKKIGHLRGNERLKLEILNDNNRIKRISGMAPYVKRRMLYYLLNDTTDGQRTSFDLCKAIVLQQCRKGESINCSIPLIQYIDFIDNNECIKPGDMIGFCTKKNQDEDFAILLFKQYAIALSPDLYLTKNDAGFLYIMSYALLKEYSSCDTCVKIHPAIGKRDDFINDPFCSIKYRKVKIKIYPNEKDPQFISIPTTIVGLKTTNGEVALRSDLQQVTGTIDGIRYNSLSELTQFLHTGKVKKYLLAFHKRVYPLQKDEVLTIEVYHDAGKKIVPLSNRIKKNLLAYLMYDSEDDSKQCFHFCKKLCLEEWEKNNLLPGSYKEDLMYVQEEDLKPGDPLIFFQKTKDEEHINKHYTVTLIDQLYISRFGNAGMFIVAYMNDMMKYFKCDCFAKISSDITRYYDFAQEYLPNK